MPITTSLLFLALSTPVQAHQELAHLSVSEVFDALAGRAPAAHRHMLEPPTPLLAPAVPTPAPDKAVMAGRLDNWLDSTNFTVAWSDGNATDADAEDAIDGLEAAWQALVVEQGWGLPVSTDRYLLMVVLDPTIPGSGYTTVYTSDEYPEGFPVIFLNTGHAASPLIFQTLCAHELSHAIQFALRDWTATSEQAWYWEASAEWMAELARPELDMYALSAFHYARNPAARYDHTDDYHHYGMFLLNAAIEERITGDGGVYDIWQLAAERPDDTWDSILVEALGLSLADLWGTMTGAVGNRTLAESNLYAAVQGVVELEDGLEGELEMLGTQYLEVLEDCSVTVDATGDGGSLILAGPDTYGATVNVYAGDMLAVTATSEPAASYRLSVGPLVELEDTGLGDGGERAGACSAAPAAGAWLALLGLPLVVGRRRRG